MINIKLDAVTCTREEQTVVSSFSADFTGSRLTVILSESEETSVALLRMIAGLQPPLSGTLLYDDTDFYAKTLEAQSKILRYNSYVFDTGGVISNLSVSENILLPYDFIQKSVSENQKLEEAEVLIKFFELDDDILQKRPSMLTKSEIKLVNYIRAYLISPEMVFIESPFARLTKRTANLVEKIVLERAFEKNIPHFFSKSNNSSLVEKADTVIAIKKGEATLLKKGIDFTDKFDYLKFYDQKEIK